jgi:RNA polymerase sigma-70 factor, ECF subfamily
VPLVVADDNRPSSSDAWSAFEAEAMPHADRLFRLAMWMEGDRQEAKDLVQETLLRALRSFDRYLPGTNCRAWLLTILQNVRSNRRRARFRRQVFEEADDRIAETVAFLRRFPVASPPSDGSVAMLTPVDGLHVAAFRGTDRVVFLISALEDADLHDVAQAIEEPVSRALGR